MMLIVGTSLHIASAATTMPTTSSSQTNGEKMIQNTINAESARSAELNVELNSKLGIIHTLRRHSTGNDVKLLQQFLKVYGVYPEGLVTGYFGPLTEQAVKKFQEEESIDNVGIAGPKTRTRIFEISQQKAKSIATKSISANPKIIDAVLTTDIAENGIAIAPATSFTSTTIHIYAVLSLKDVVQDTKISYIRYYENSYVDSGISHPSRKNLAYYHFQWSLKPGSNRLTGNYSIVFYINDKSAKTIQYTIY